MIGIYKIHNLINNKIYIGQSKDILSRFKQHQADYKKEKQSTKLLYKAMRKYGVENFTFEIVEECSIEELDEKEAYYIELYNTFAFKEGSNGYNMNLGGEGNRGCIYTQEFKDKMSKIKKDFYKNNKHPRLGTTLSEEIKMKISKSNSGEKSAWYGKKHTKEEIEKISQGNKGKIMSEEAREKMRKNHADVSGGNNPRARKVVCEGVIFNSIKECAEFYKKSPSTFKNWLRGYSKMPQEFLDKGLSYCDKVGD